MRKGLFIIGAYGNVSLCTGAATAAIAEGETEPIGVLTETSLFRGLHLTELKDIVIGGCDIRKGNLAKDFEEFCAANSITFKLGKKAKKMLAQWDENIFPGITADTWVSPAIATNGFKKVVKTVRDVVEIFSGYISDFRRKNDLSEVVVINLASAERTRGRLPESVAPVTASCRTAHPQHPAGEKNLLACSLEEVPLSSALAAAAILNGCPYVNFTSSTGSSWEPIDRLARKHRVPHYGRDAKTGETLVKTVLAPMFTIRNLLVLSWESHNILGNRDGLVLTQPGFGEAKIADKARISRELLGYEHDSNVRIDYTPSLNDWKVAWNFIHFKGLFDTKMSMQFIWQGCDSILAAPLVIDLFRLAEHSHRCGFSGAMKHLALFFKNPYLVSEHNLHKQFEILLSGIRRQAARVRA